MKFFVENFIKFSDYRIFFNESGPQQVDTVNKKKLPEILKTPEEQELNDLTDRYDSLNVEGKITNDYVNRLKELDNDPEAPQDLKDSLNRKRSRLADIAKQVKQLAMEKTGLKGMISYIENNPEYKGKGYEQTLRRLFELGGGEQIADFSVAKDFHISLESTETTFNIINTLKTEEMLDSFPHENIINNNEEVSYQYNEGVSDASFENVPDRLKKIVNIAKAEVGNHEKHRSTDKYFKEIGFNFRTDKTPWCAGFVNWVLQKAGYPGTGSLAAKSFIEGSGYGHVGFKVGDKILGGNQGNSVNLRNINKPIVGYSIPTENGLQVYKGVVKKEDVPDGAIIVYNRNPKKKQYA